MNRAGLVGDKLKLLNEDEVELIHESALKLLKNLGVKVDSEEFLEILEGNGARVNYENGRAKLSPELVRDYLEIAPSRITLHGRKKEYDLSLEDRKVHYGTGGAAVKILDLNSEEVRSSTLEDQARLARLVENLDNVHFFQAPVVPTDVPEEDLSLNSVYASLTGTHKNVQESVTSPEKVDEIVDMGAIIAGSREEFLARPFVSFVTSWMVSPLKLDIETTKVLRRITNYKIPVALSTAPVTGSTAPATLSGLLVQVHAEELFGITLAQMFSEETPVLYGPVPAAANMKNMAYLAGAPETGMMNAATVQLANHIDVPIYSDAGETDSKLPDTQAGAEAALNLLQVGLAGGNYIHHAAGMMESMLCVADEKFVIDNDIIGMALRVLQGIDVDQDKLGLDVIEEVGPGNNFLTQPHTVNYSRSDEFYKPSVVDREDRTTWENNGSMETRPRARKRARELLEDVEDNLLPEDVDEKIRDRFNIHLPK
ncbi:MAG: trimethylamine methyltransferase family protein [Candidatus Bipolaricaulota bacterium]|nr:trimethylamine methyltransferase family protein [Candidatus Bipolaricaulota bacterium]